MFRLIKPPSDPVFPKTLEGLGYFVNEDSQIRMTKDLTRKFQYYMNRNSRYRDVHRAAFDKAVKKILLQHFNSHGLVRKNLPLDPTDDNRHVPILLSQNLSNCDRVVLVFNDFNQDLGVWSWRMIGGDAPHEGLKQGSMISMMEYFEAKIQKHKECAGYKSPGFLIANSGELFWWQKGQETLSIRNWEAIPRENSLECRSDIQGQKNLVPENETQENHFKYILGKAVPTLVNPQASIQIISLATSTPFILEWLEKSWSSFGARLEAVAFIGPSDLYLRLDNDPEAMSYLIDRSCAFLSSMFMEDGTGNPNSDERARRDDLSIKVQTVPMTEFEDELIMPAAVVPVIDYLEDAHLKSIQDKGKTT